MGKGDSLGAVHGANGPIEHSCRQVTKRHVAISRRIDHMSLADSVRVDA